MVDVADLIKMLDPLPFSGHPENQELKVSDPKIQAQVEKCKLSNKKQAEEWAELLNQRNDLHVRLIGFAFFGVVLVAFLFIAPWAWSSLEDMVGSTLARLAVGVGLLAVLWFVMFEVPRARRRQDEVLDEWLFEQEEVGRREQHDKPLDED